MLYKHLGMSSLRIPALVQGITGTGGYADYNTAYVDNRLKIIRCGMDLGLTFLDTAEIYGGGLSEEIIGKAVKGQRDKAIIASKCYPQGNVRKNILSSVEGSLKRLQTEYIDLYQIHWPNPLVSLKEIMETLAKLVEQGKIAHIGLSNFSLPELAQACNILPHGGVASIQREYNLLDRSIEEDLLPFCEAGNITVIAYSPLNQGRMFYSREQEKILQELAGKYDRTIPQIILRWLVSRRAVVAAVRTRTIGHMQANVAAMDFDMDEDDILSIDTSKKAETSTVLCRRIRLAVKPGCPVYSTVDEALENRLDLIPSPLAVSKLLLSRNTALPIRLVPTLDPSGRYDYDIDGYDINDSNKKYWGWVIAHGQDREIPAYILSHHGLRTSA